MRDYIWVVFWEIHVSSSSFLKTTVESLREEFDTVAEELLVDSELLAFIPYVQLDDFMTQYPEHVNVNTNFNKMAWETTYSGVRTRDNFLL
jgi:hypothetical protein